jgi:hypothetical protein
MRNVLQPRRGGFALTATVMGLLLVAAIVSGGFYASSHESTLTRTNDAASKALFVAETGLHRTIATVRGPVLSAIPREVTMAGPSGAVSYGGRTVGSYTTTLTRTAGNLYVVRATGTLTAGGPYIGATRSLAQVVRIKTANFDKNTAIQVYGNLQVTGNSTVIGTDTYDPSWADCAFKSGSSAVLGNPNSQIILGGSGVVNGLVTKRVLNPSDFTLFGDYTYAQVAALADYVYQPGASLDPRPAFDANDNCNITDQLNWGSPTSADACSTWFPIMYAPGSVRITGGGTGQGILLVDGDLEMSGGFTFYGAVVVLGKITVTGTGGHVRGTLLSFGGGSFGSMGQLIGDATVQYSSCAIDRAVKGNPNLSRGVPINNRSWLDMSAITNG